MSTTLKYVQGYDSLHEARRAKDADGESITEWIIGYSTAPDWRFSTRGEAEVALSDLNEKQFHVGLHYCEFAIQELPEGDFAIACITHPMP